MLDLALHRGPIQRPVARRLFGPMLQHDLQELLSPMQEAGFVDIEVGPVAYRVLGFALLGFVLGRAGKQA